MPILRISGGTLTDDCFSIVTPDEGEITWNVTKLQDAADTGRFGKPETFETASMPPADWSKGFLDRERVDGIKASSLARDIPAILIGSPPGRGFRFRCICDGQHRITARMELKLPTFKAFVVPWDVEKQFRVAFSLEGP